MIYSCGPTVYDKVHIGNLRIYILSDVLKTFLHQTSIINITDIDDKILSQLQKNSTYAEYLNFVKVYTDYFYAALSAVNIKHAEHLFIKVSDSIPLITTFIELIDKTNLIRDQDNSIRFKNENTNFVLWKIHENDKISWATNLGIGRPGWHTQCAAIIFNILQTQHLNNLQYHLAGLDLKQIHNAAETVLLAHVNVKIDNWIHVASVCVNHIKMSKSKGNSVYIEDLPTAESYVLRFFMLSRNFNKTINYTHKVFIQKRTELLSLYKELINFDIKKTTTYDFIKFCKDNNYDLNSTPLLILDSGSILSKLKKLELCDSYNNYMHLNQFYKILPQLSFDIFFITQLKQLVKDYKLNKLLKNYEISDSCRQKLKQKGFNINDKNFELIPFKF